MTLQAVTTRQPEHLQVVLQEASGIESAAVNPLGRGRALATRIKTLPRTTGVKPHSPAIPRATQHQISAPESPLPSLESVRDATVINVVPRVVEQGQVGDVISVLSHRWPRRVAYQALGRAAQRVLDTSVTNQSQKPDHTQALLAKAMATRCSRGVFNRTALGAVGLTLLGAATLEAGCGTLPGTKPSREEAMAKATDGLAEVVKGLRGESLGNRKEVDPLDRATAAVIKAMTDGKYNPTGKLAYYFLPAEYTPPDASIGFDPPPAATTESWFIGSPRPGRRTQKDGVDLSSGIIEQWQRQGGLTKAEAVAYAICMQQLAVIAPFLRLNPPDFESPNVSEWLSRLCKGAEVKGAKIYAYTDVERIFGLDLRIVYANADRALRHLLAAKVLQKAGIKLPPLTLLGDSFAARVSIAEQILRTLGFPPEDLLPFLADSNLPDLWTYIGNHAHMPKGGQAQTVGWSLSNGIETINAAGVQRVLRECGFTIK